MTATDKERIRLLRGGGHGYKAIAAKLSLPAATVKSYCHRNGLMLKTDEIDTDACRQCGKLLGDKLPGAEQKKFCSDACRSTWWNRHAYLREPKEKDRRVCVLCGHVFYSRKARKYCGHACYIRARFGGKKP